MRVLLQYSGMMAFVPMPLAIGYALAGAPPLALRDIAAAWLLILTVPIVLHLGVSIDRWVLLMSATTCVAVTAIAVSGGDPTRAFPWLLLALMVARIVSGARIGAIVLGLSVATVASWFTISHLSALPAPWLPAAVPGQRATDLGCLFACVYLLSAVATRDHNAAVARLRASGDRLEEEVHGHARTQTQLTEAHAQVVATARVAGMAEVASSVIHDVGTALNTVGVTAQVVGARLTDATSEQRLERLAGLLEHEKADPAAIARYVRSLSKLSQDARQQMTSEMSRLESAVAHVASVIRAQQAHARSRGVVESFDVRDAVDEATRLVRPALDATRVTLTTVGTLDVALTTERYQVVQVLEHLLRNAVEALAASNQERTVIIRASLHGHSLQLQVADNGPGIALQDRARVFESGFSRKTHGGGFGLHASALAARALGGSLELDPAGNAGASFSLSIPIHLRVATPASAEVARMRP